MEDSGKPRRRPDGSLDTDHYRDIGQRLRGAKARRWLRSVLDVLRGRRADAASGLASDGHP